MATTSTRIKPSGSDSDYFKRYDDSYGHEGGDDCLMRMTQAIAQAIKRPTDLVARYGGKEFAAILSNTTIESGSRLRRIFKLQSHFWQFLIKALK
ncbi:diguanylate cyclase domain-containing protein [Leptolyngbya sp. Cla-17]|uniref:diguanylate cyclase domain-containing protein n=1 Tax=Leptolyngbya sp. Cla-17 TaxID=2803751 RepID=UPI0018D9D79F|nr:diguanylate cyclase [Leptolyngbya sp. Cla-17]